MAMSVVVADQDFTLYVGDVRETLAGLPAESVHCVVTSPPYWGLRDYGTGSWEGGDDGCDHSKESKSSAAIHKEGFEHPFRAGKAYTDHREEGWGDVCGKCGARRVDHQLGLEPTPEEYVANMVAVFREVRRVLRRDGTCWLNIGDSYASGKAGRSDTETMHEFDVKNGRQPANYPISDAGGVIARTPPPGLKQKDLVGIPWRLAFALQADGWYLRSDIIWSKPNPMPESVTDRPTKAHEYLFLLTRSPRYFYDPDAIREPHAVTRWSGNGEVAKTAEVELDQRGDSRAWTPNVREYNPAGRNKRSVWEIATEPYPDAHFATFPQALVEPCVLAGCPVGGVVLDPFMGSGTTALVARRHGRRSIGVELNAEYAALAAKRTRQLSLLAGTAE